MEATSRVIIPSYLTVENILNVPAYIKKNKVCQTQLNRTCPGDRRRSSNSS